jgi:hypothetical protein
MISKTYPLGDIENPNGMTAAAIGRVFLNVMTVFPLGPLRAEVTWLPFHQSLFFGIPFVKSFDHALCLGVNAVICLLFEPDPARRLR